MDDRLLEQNNLMYQGHGWLQYTAAFPILVKVIRGLLQDQGSLKKIHGILVRAKETGVISRIILGQALLINNPGLSG